MMQVSLYIKLIQLSIELTGKRRCIKTFWERGSWEQNKRSGTKELSFIFPRKLDTSNCMAAAQYAHQVKI